MQYSFTKSLRKAAKAVGILLGVTALTAFGSKDFADAAQTLPAATIIVPVIQGLAVIGIDWLNHKSG